METKDKTKLRIMVDANILVAGTGWPRFPYEVMRHATKGDFQLMLSSYIILEARQHIIRMMPEKLADFEIFLKESCYEDVPTPTLEEVSANTELVRDVKDIPIALAAINAKVDFLISQDKDFTAQDETTEKLRQQLKIMLSGTFLREQMGWTSEQLEAIRNRKGKELT